MGIDGQAPEFWLGANRGRESARAHPEQEETAREREQDEEVGRAEEFHRRALRSRYHPRAVMAAPTLMTTTAAAATPRYRRAVRIIASPSVL